MEHHVAELTIEVLARTVTALLHRDGADLTARQLAVFLTCYLESEPQTVRGLAAKLGVSRPTITHVLDRLCEFDLLRRKTDPVDRRGILVQRTVIGGALLHDIKAILAEADRQATKVLDENGRSAVVA